MAVPCAPKCVCAVSCVMVCGCVRTTSVFGTRVFARVDTCTFRDPGFRGTSRLSHSHTRVSHSQSVSRGARSPRESRETERGAVSSSPRECAVCAVRETCHECRTAHALGHPHENSGHRRYNKLESLFRPAITRSNSSDDHPTVVPCPSAGARCMGKSAHGGGGGGVVVSDQRRGTEGQAKEVSLR